MQFHFILVILIPKGEICLWLTLHRESKCRFSNKAVRIGVLLQHTSVGLKLTLPTHYITLLPPTVWS